LWFTDVQGFLKSVSISPQELETAFEEGMTFDGSAINGYARLQEADMLAKPDPSTFQILPWRRDEQVARMFCDIVTPEGEAFAGDPRTVLKRNLRRAAELGFTFYVAPELEYFYFADSGPEPKVLDRGGYFDLTPLDVAQEYRRKTINALEQLGIPVEHSHHEVAPVPARDHRPVHRRPHHGRQHHELPAGCEGGGTGARHLRHLHAQAAREPRRLRHAPPPLAVQGRRERLRQWDHGELSATGKAFVAGLLRHSREITAVTNQWVNSYKRLVAGFEAPIYVSWGRNNQSALVRVPSAKRGKPESVRVEYRSPDSAANPYLALSVLLAAGLEGVAQGYELPAEAPGNVFELSSKERQALGIERLPETLAQALDVMESSELVRNALGDHVFNWFLRNKRKEWERYQHHVSRFELETYLPVL
jgi:glutamine synthetase